MEDAPLRRLVIVACLALFAPSAEGAVLSGVQIRAQAGAEPQLVGEALTLPDGGAIISVECDGDGFWIEGPGGPVTYRKPSAAVHVALLRGTYRAFPNLRTGQERATVTLQIQTGGASTAPTLAGTWAGTFRNSLGDTGKTTLRLRVEGGDAEGDVGGEVFRNARWDGSSWRFTYSTRQGTYSCELRLITESRARMDYRAMNSAMDSSTLRTWTGSIELVRVGEVRSTGELVALVGSWSGTYRNTLGDSGPTSLRIRAQGDGASGELDGEPFADARWDGSALMWTYVSDTTKATYTCQLRLVGDNRARMEYQASGSQNWSGVAEFAR